MLLSARCSSAQLRRMETKQRLNYIFNTLNKEKKILPRTLVTGFKDKLETEVKRTELSIRQVLCISGSFTTTAATTTTTTLQIMQMKPFFITWWNGIPLLSRLVRVQVVMTILFCLRYFVVVLCHKTLGIVSSATGKKIPAMNISLSTQLKR